MLFSYNSSPDMGIASTAVDDHAKALLRWLRIGEAEGEFTAIYGKLRQDPIIKRMCQETEILGHSFPRTKHGLQVSEGLGI